MCAQLLGQQVLEQFIKDRLVCQEGLSSPKQLFSSTLSKSTARTFAHLHDTTEATSGKKVPDPVKANREELVNSLEAHRPVDIKEVASHELISIPVSIFETNGMMRTGTKSTMVASLMGATCEEASPGVQYINLPTIPQDSILLVDLMGRVHAIGYQKGVATFGEYANLVISSIVGGARVYGQVHVISDRYPAVSPKDHTNEVREEGFGPYQEGH